MSTSREALELLRPTDHLQPPEDVTTLITEIFERSGEYYEQFRTEHPATPLLRSEGLSTSSSATFVKHEGLRAGRSFKILGQRYGVENAVAQGATDLRLATAGGAGIAAALVAQEVRKQGTPIRLNNYVPYNTPQAKIETMLDYGATVTLAGTTYDEAAENCAFDAEREGAYLLHSNQSLDCLIGTAVLAWELHEQAPDSVTDLVLPIGAGGVAGAVFSVWSRLRPDDRRVAAQVERNAAVLRSLDEGAAVEETTLDTRFGGLAVARAYPRTLELARELVQTGAVLEATPAFEALGLLNHEGMISYEPAGAVAPGVAMELGSTEAGEQRVFLAVATGANDNSYRELAEQAARWRVLDTRHDNGWLETPRMVILER